MQRFLENLGYLLVTLLSLAAATAFGIIILALSGCAFSYNTAQLQGRQQRLQIGAPIAQASPYCQSLDNQHRWWYTGSIFTGALSGASGLSLLEVPRDDAHYTRDRNIIIGTTVGLAATSVAMKIMDSSVSQTWVKECAQ